MRRSEMKEKWTTGLLAVLVAGASLAAPTAPMVKAAGIINGMLNVCVKKSPLDGCALEVQMKDVSAADEAYVTIRSP